MQDEIDRLYKQVNRKLDIVENDLRTDLEDPLDKVLMDIEMLNQQINLSEIKSFLFEETSPGGT